MDPGEPAALEDEELGTMWAVSAAMSGCVDPPPTDQYLHPHRLAGGRAVADAVADAVAVLVNAVHRTPPCRASACQYPARR